MAAKKHEKISLEIKFWKDWLKADLIKRYELIEMLSIIRDLENIERLPKKMRKHFFAQLLNSYFEDLENTIRTLKT